MKRKVHYRSLRLFVNAGMSFPACYAKAELLDLDKSRLAITSTQADVTCETCKRIVSITNSMSAVNRRF